MAEVKKELFNPKMLILIVVGALLAFLLVTFSNQWGTAMGKRYFDEAMPIVKGVRDGKYDAMRSCPSVIKKLKSAVEEFQEKGDVLQTGKTHRLLFECNMAIKAYEEAKTNIDAMLKLAPQDAKLHGSKAELLIATKKYALAQRSAHLAEQIDPENYRWILMQAKCWVKLRQFNKAVTEYKKAIKAASNANEDPQKLREIVAEYEQLNLMIEENKGE